MVKVKNSKQTSINEKWTSMFMPKTIRQKKEVKQMEDYRKSAYALFFEEKMNIKEIANRLPVSEKSIALYLRSCPGYLGEKERRKKQNKEKRKEYQRAWEKENRCMNVTAASMRREHEIAVRVLSSEKY